MVKKQDMANQIFEMMNTAIEASNEMMTYLSNNQNKEFLEVYEGVHMLLSTIAGVAKGLKEEENNLNLPTAIVSVIVSLERIGKISEQDVDRACHKIEYELIPLIEEMRIEFYYWGMVYPDEEKMKKYNEEDIHWLGRNKYVEESEEVGEYKFDLSIIVTGYNKLEYTKLCVDSLLKNLPKKLTYELIFINHGSSDGTKEFFESVKPDKQLDIAVNGGGMKSVYRIVQGRYNISISNDVIVTKNAIDNLYKCISSEDKIVWVVPSTPNISNLQTIRCNYSNKEEFNRFVELNNKSNYQRWEQRFRLCDPIEITRNKFINEYKIGYRFFSCKQQSFTDDRMSLYCRRNGYKMYLAKDAFCHHFGSITLSEDKSTNSAEAFLEGRKKFKNVFGIDPWDYGMCYAYNLFNEYQFNKYDSDINILGIYSGLGSNPLKIKETLKENTGKLDVFVKIITNKCEYIEDLKGVVDDVELCENLEKVESAKNRYNYLIYEKLVCNEEELKYIVDVIMDYVCKRGVIIIRIKISLIEELERYNVQHVEIKGTKVIRETNDYGWIILEM